MSKFDPEIHHRRSIRLRDYDYSQAGAYVVTICVQDRACLFGEVVNGEMQPNAAGQMVDRWWLELANKYPSVELDEYVIMPNHFHGILVIVGGPLRGRPVIGSEPPTDRTVAWDETGTGRPRRATPTLCDMMDWFKTMTTNEYIRGVKTLGWSRFNGRFWQRGYYDHVLRDEEELERAREYIALNPMRWEEDGNHPANR